MKKEFTGSRISGAPHRAAFTLVELLVVIGIIAILAGLVLGGAGIATVKSRIARVQSERAALETAIQEYKAHKGYFPPDNTNCPYVNSLYYELTGMVTTNNVAKDGGGAGFVNANGDQISANHMQTLFNVGGVLNSSSDPTQPAENFMASASKAQRTASFTTNGFTTIFTLFGIQVPPGVPSSVSLKPVNSAGVTLWNYISSNPTNNASAGFDLWMDVAWRGTTNRISNWNPDPQPVQ